MMTGRTGDRDLEGWLTAVEADDHAGLRSLATGIRNDQQAVTNGLTLPYSSGKVEGTVNKIKTIKRQMYGRASFALLRKRVTATLRNHRHKIRGRARYSPARCSRNSPGPGLCLVSSRVPLPGERDTPWPFVGPVAGAVHEDLVAGVDQAVEQRLGDDRVGEQRVPVRR